jgi:L-alanine-DL-glutamate epimerase-like enolase superfamily enzyme|tara:strand:- start:173 stop:1336 length:1164 start_codon:yes stop_codon:yes gene_type:complete
VRILEIRERTVPLAGNVANAVVNFSEHTVSLVALISDQTVDGRTLVGFGFNSIGRFGQAGILRERMIPRVLAADPSTLLASDHRTFDAAAIAATAMRNEKPGGHGDRAGALGALELAVWDLNAKLGGEPAYRTIARHFGHSVERRPATVYAAGGYYYPGASMKRLREELKQYRSIGFDAFKLKIGGAPLAEDMQRIETALDVAGDSARLSVDANGRFDLDTALEYGRAMQPLGLRWYEEPGDPLDYALNRAIAEAYDGPIATGENLFSAIDASNLVRFGGMRPGKDIFQMDAGLSYGLTEYTRMIGILEQHGITRAQCFPHGGHLINLHIAVALDLGGCEAYPGVFQPFGGYPPECDVADGLVWPTEVPGFGLELKRELRTHLDILT